MYKCNTTMDWGVYSDHINTKKKYRMPISNRVEIP